MLTCRHISAISICLLMMGVMSWGQGADDPEHAGLLILGETTLGTTQNAVPDQVRVACGDSPGLAQWHQLVVDQDQTVRLVVQSSWFQPVVTIFRPEEWTEVRCQSASYNQHSVTLNLVLSAHEPLLIRVAGAQDCVGAYNITPWPDPFPGMIHDEPNEAIPLLLNEPYPGTTAGATGSELSFCGLDDTRDVWHTFTPDTNGVVSIALTESSFDGVLSVVDPCHLGEWLCGYVSCIGGAAQLTLPVRAKQTLMIRVAGDHHQEGDYTIVVTRFHEPADRPANPSPIHQADQIDLKVTLSWAHDPNLLKPRTTAAASGGLSSITIHTIYGTDDRQDEFEINQPEIVEAGRSVGMILDPIHIIQHADGRMHLDTDRLLDAHARRTGRLLCPEERFLDQASAGTATGFLVAPQILATAGHVVSCWESYQLERMVLFDFVMLDANTPNLDIHPDDLYRMEEVIAYNDGIPDWALVRLDRPVQGYRPLSLRRSGQLSDADSLLVIGHPLGLPRKYSLNGRLMAHDAYGFFESDLDVNAGHSGSPVLNASTLQVEGILFAGNVDFVPVWGDNGRCYQSLVCPDDPGQCDGWEWITRSSQFADLVLSYDVYLGPDPHDLPRVAENIVEASLAVSSLSPNTTYHWRVTAHTSEGPLSGPLWAFTTAAPSHRD